MSRYFNLALRSFFVLAGAALIVYSIVESTGRLILCAPAIFGILLIVQGFAGT
jgi:hypothetical protein